MQLGPDGRPCRVCDSFKNFAHSNATGDDAAKGKKTKKPKEAAPVDSAPAIAPMECPPDSQELGRSTWTFLHTMAAYYPEKPTKAEQSNAKKFLESFSHLYPCGYCASHLREEMKQDPPDVSSNKALSLWLCLMHNKVNEMQGKDTFDCSKVFERWRDGRPGDNCGN